MINLKLWNSTDLDLSRQGILAPEQVRSAAIEGLVDTGSTELALPRDVVEALGLPTIDTRRMRDTRGIVVELDRVGSLELEILGRKMTCNALVLPEGATPLIGQVQLGVLDLLVDSKSQQVRINPSIGTTI